ncbi:DUF349 domain-containing protein [Alteromonas oceanisediminis]|uniref:DUF349 domain-containing protein n=1 Tax=Alteromonas oceanisediminis TaxID=2836180 RepID=UPI001BD9B7D5|nr:DUF349 domain-containing protein [Alteromonas oceanisediminis]MBT0586543.1 DUF349 domain-containing protein [Alteromonas oceanisediminis]
MILDRFRKPKFDHPDPTVRIKAIANLSPQKPEDKRKLHELAFNDDAASVSIAALEQLDSFTLWLKMYQIAADPRLAKAAEKRVFSALFDPDNTSLTAQERQRTLRESTHPEVIKRALQAADALALGDEDVKSMLMKLNDERFLRQFIIRSNSVVLQQWLVMQTDSLDELNKLLRKKLLPETQERLHAKISDLTFQQERPSQLVKSLTLALSKLNALKDKADFSPMMAARRDLLIEINEALDELETFDPALSVQQRDKLRSIDTAVEAVLARLKPDFDAQQALEARQQHEKEQLDAVDTQLKHSRDALREFFIAGGSEPDGAAEQRRGRVLEAINQSIAALDAIPEPVNNTTLRSNLATLAAKQISLCESASALREDYQQLLTDTHALIEQGDAAEGRANPEASSYRQSVFNTATRVNALLRQLHSLQPITGFEAWYPFVDNIKDIEKQATTENEEKFASCRRKLRTCESLIHQGKLKPATSVFHKLQNAYAMLPESMQAKLNKRYQAVEEHINTIADWQAYVAQPRKPDLLNEVEKAVKAPLSESIEARAKRVKLWRADWMSFGRLNTPEDDELNERFNAVIEQAFAPCREHYENLEKQRLARAEQAESMLTELGSLASVDENDVFLKRYRKLTQQWRNLGEVDRQRWQTLRKRFAEVNQPLKQRQQTILSANEQAKQRLVNKAQAFAQATADTSTNEIKALQREWKSIGTAGRKQDDILWQAFRAAGDSVFSRAKETQQQQQNLANEQYSQLSKQLGDVESQVDSVTEHQAKVMLLDIVAQINAAADSLGKQLRPLKSQVEEIEKLVRTRSEAHKKAEQVAQRKAVFDYLRSRVGESELVTPEAPKWVVQALAEPVSDQSELSRAELTVRIECVLQVESPASESELRQQQQLALMTAKLQDGTLDSADDLWKAWIAHGQVSESEIDQLTRIELAMTGTDQGAQ